MISLKSTYLTITILLLILFPALIASDVVVVFSVICVLYFGISRKIQQQENIFILFILLAVGFVSIFINQDINIPSKEYFKYFIIIFLVSGYPFQLPKINFKWIDACIMIILISQLAYFFNFKPLTLLFDALYPVGDKWYLLDFRKAFGSTYNIRFSGLMYNPNDCAKFYTLLYSTSLLYDRKNARFFNISIMVGILLTGSRTGLASYLVITFLHQVYISKISNDKIIVGIIALVFVSLIIFAFPSLFEFRSMKVTESSSISYKTELLLNYLNDYPTNHTIKFILGNISAESAFFKNNPNIFQGFNFSFDADFSYTLVSFGVLSFILLYGFIFFNPLIKVKEMKIFLGNSVWVFSAGFFFHTRFILLFILLSSLINSHLNNLEETKKLELENKE